MSAPDPYRELRALAEALAEAEQRYLAGMVKSRTTREAVVKSRDRLRAEAQQHEATRKQAIATAAAGRLEELRERLKRDSGAANTKLGALMVVIDRSHEDLVADGHGDLAESLYDVEPAAVAAVAPPLHGLDGALKRAEQGRLELIDALSGVAAYRRVRRNAILTISAVGGGIGVAAVVVVVLTAAWYAVGSLFSGDGVDGSAKNARMSETPPAPDGRAFVRVEPGSFRMGSPPAELGRQDDERSHAVTLTRPYWIAPVEVTQGWFERVTGRNPSAHRGHPDWPVENVTWSEAVDFANRVSDAEGLPLAYEIRGARVTWDSTASGYRLPTEAEWEYAARASAAYRDAARAGAAHRWAGSDSMSSVAWVKEFTSSPQPVGRKQPNALGLFDMSGNVFEWVWDRYPCVMYASGCDGAYAASAAVDPTGPASGPERIYRGGDWRHEGKFARVANRGSNTPDSRDKGVGFRLVRYAEPSLP